MGSEMCIRDSGRIGIDRAVVDIKLRVDNGFAWHNVGLFVADSVIGRRWYIIFGIYKIK